MAAKPLTTEAIAFTEKKMNMALDDIIKMSKSNPNKPKKQQIATNERQKPGRNNSVKEKALKVQQYMNSRSFVRQGALAQRRSNFQGNQFPMAADAARKAAFVPVRVRAFNGGRVANMNKPRFAGPAVQRRPMYASFPAKPQLQHQQRDPHMSTLPKQKPRTLDSLFANMKEERMRASLRSNNPAQRDGGWQFANMKEERMRASLRSNNPAQRDGGWQRRPWGRGRFNN